MASEKQLSRYGAISRMLPKLAPQAQLFIVSKTSPAWYADHLSGAFPNDAQGNPRLFSTIALAVAACTDGRGDVVLVMPNHTETIAAATTLAAIGGVSIVGMGEGNNRPTITFATSTAASIVMAASNVTFDNFIFVGNIASQVVALDFSGFAGGKVLNCTFKSGGATKAPLVTIKTDVSSIDMVIDSNDFNYSTNTSNMPTELVTMVGCDRLKFTNNYVSGNFSTGVLNNITTLANDVQIENNAIYNLNTTATAGFVMLTGTTGYIGMNVCYTAAASNTNFFVQFIQPASCLLDSNWIQNALGNGVGGDLSAPQGSYLVIQKSITSSTITTGAQDMTLVSVGGDLYLENAILETDSTGLAGATNFRILKNGGEGLAAVIEETVANLGANKTVDSYTASVVKQRCTLKSGQKFQFLGTASSGTGAGVVKVTLVLVRAKAGAHVAPA